MKAVWAYRKLPERIEQMRSDPTVQLSIAAIILLAVFFLYVVHKSLLRWEREEKEAETRCTG